MSLSALLYAQIPSYVPQYGLLSYYPFDGTANDASTNGNHLTNNGATLTNDRFNTANAAYNFNGSSQYLIRNTPSYVFSPTSTFTVSLWYNRTNSAVVGIPIMHATTAAGNFIWIFQAGAANMQFGTNKQQSAWVWAQSTTTTSVWTHIVMVYNAGAMTLYKDNVLVATASFTYTGVTSTTLPLYVGRGVSGNYFSGKVDDIGIWNRCLTTCEINDLFTASNSLTGVSAGPNMVACNGGPITLSGTGATNYFWNNNVTNGTAFSPTSNQTYTVTGFNANGCSAWDQTDVTLETFNIDAGANQSICQGNSVTLSATGASAYTWNNNVLDGQAFVPNQGGYYTASATSVNGCVANDSLFLTINPLPLIEAGMDTSVCGGASILLNATGASNLTWNGNIANGQSILVTNSSVLTVSGTSAAGCVGQDSLYVTVNAIPNIIAGPDVWVCAGQTATFNAVGGVNLQWNNGITDGVPFTPVASGTYIVTGMSNDGCYGSDTLQLNFGNLPDLNAGPDQLVCSGDSVVLNGSGGIFMYWNNSVIDGIAFVPTATSTYVLTGSSNDGCVSTDTVLVSVLNPSSSTITASAIDSYTLNGQTYTASGTYIQTIPNANGCDSTITLQLTLDFTGLAQIESARFQMYPNPATDIIVLDLDPELIGEEMRLFNTEGKCVQSHLIANANQTIQIQQLQAGIYFIQIGDAVQKLAIE
ncbi:MAG: hypothetical protein RLZZ301_59 [Bacteroidota bacterium]